MFSVYLLGSATYAVFLLFRFLGDSTTAKSDRTSWLVIAIASAIWVVAIPLSIMEIKAKAKAKAKLATMPKPTRFGENPRYIKKIEQVEG